LRLPAQAARNITTIAEDEAMGMTHVIRNIKRQIAQEVANKSAEVKLDLIRSLVYKGSLTIEQARAEVKEMLQAKAIPEALARSTLDQLG
jgi:polyhydroxyalkanoate synthesis regulator phasin